MIGLFINLLPLRADLSGNPTFRAFLGQVRQTVLAALDHQDFPTLRLVQRLQPPRDLSRPPLCQTMFVLDTIQRIPRDTGAVQSARIKLLNLAAGARLPPVSSGAPRGPRAARR